MTVGKFITFEGGEGAGKSTQARLLWERLKRNRVNADLTREPGGTIFAEAIRALLLDATLAERSTFSEILLFYAARADHLVSRIKPALRGGTWVICDRFSDSTRAYQGAANKLHDSIIEDLERLVVGSAAPDLTIILDVDPEIGMRRAVRRAYGSVNSQSRLFEPEQLAFSFALDRFESLDIEFHRKVRRLFLSIADRHPERCAVIDSTGGISKVAECTWKIVTQRLGDHLSVEPPIELSR